MNLLIKIFELLKARTYIDWSGVIFALQLLAWDKLSRENQIPEGLKISQFADNPDIVSFIRYVFGELNKEYILGDNALAFEYDDRHLRALRGEDLYSLLSLVSHSSKNEDFSFDKIIDDCIRFIGPRNNFSSFLPSELTDLLVKLGELQKSNQVYCPFDGSLRAAVKANYITPNVSVEVRTHSPFPYLLNIIFDRSIVIKEGNPVIDDPNFVEGENLKKFDVVLANPPFGVRYQNNDLISFFDTFNRFPEETLFGDVLQIRHILAQTKKRAVIVVSDGLLFRTTAGEKEFKKDIVESGMVKSVIGLPSGLLTYTSISLSLIVLEKGKPADSILFINASSEHFYEKRRGSEGIGLGKYKLINSDEILRMLKTGDSKFSRRVSSAECAANDYNLLAQRYVLEDTNTGLDDIINKAEVRLDELAEFQRPQSLKDYIAEDGNECFEVAVGDIGEDGVIKQPQKSFYLPPPALGKLQQQKLLPEDILLTIKGSTGKVGMVPPDLTENWFANQSFLVLRIRYNKYFENPIVLFRYLTSPIGQALLQRLVGGTSVPMIQTKDIKMLPVIVPPHKMQAAIIKDHEKIVSIYEEINILREKARKIEKKNWTIN